MQKTSPTNQQTITRSNPLALAGMPAPVRFVLDKLSCLDVLRDWYDDWLKTNDQDVGRFLDYALARVGSELIVENREVLASLPRNKPIIIVANHPLGALEGMFLSRLLLEFRPDLKVLANELLLHFKEFRELFIGVDVLNPNKQQLNARGMKLVSRHLAGGGALLMFPAGTVSVMSLRNWNIRDSAWKDIVGRLALRYDALCLPIYIQGRNHRSFYLSGLIHKRLRTLLLPRAMLSQSSRSITAIIAQPLHVDSSEIATPAAATDYLRLACELLPLKEKSAPSIAVASGGTVAATPAAQLREQIQSLASCKVAEQGSLAVYCAPYDRLGCIARELALVRERTFQAAGEGSGRTLDADGFDPDYWHILVWDSHTNRLAGGYRAASVADIVSRQGKDGLYSNSLFHYDERFVAAMTGAIEVGRSFVSQDYQSSSAALDLLWRGLGAFVLRNPDCHTLFGCVSISRRFAPMIRALLAETFLKGHSASAALRALVRPVAPFRYASRFWSGDVLNALSSMSAINKLLGQAGTERRVPVLIRHYLALNGKFIDFTVNHGFSQSLDGLIMVDLRSAPVRYLRRYLGTSGAELFLQRWRARHVA